MLIGMAKAADMANAMIAILNKRMLRIVSRVLL